MPVRCMYVPTRYLEPGVYVLADEWPESSRGCDVHILQASSLISLAKKIRTVMSRGYDWYRDAAPSTGSQNISIAYWNNFTCGLTIDPPLLLPIIPSHPVTYTQTHQEGQL